MAKKPTRGATFSYAGVVVTQLSGVGGLNVENELLDVTLLGDSVRKFMPVITNGGDFPINGFLDFEEATHADIYALLSDQLGDDEGDEAIFTLSDGGTLTCSSVVLKTFEIAEHTPGESARFTATFQANDLWVYAAAVGGGG